MNLAHVINVIAKQNVISTLLCMVIHVFIGYRQLSEIKMKTESKLLLSGE